MMTRPYREPTTLISKRLLRTVAVLAAAITGSAALVAAAGVSADTTPSQTGRPLLISEVQTGGCADDGLTACTKITKQEFVELYNPLSEPLDVSGWQVRYLSASGGTATVLATLDGTVEAGSYILLAHDGFHAETADIHFGETSGTGKLAESGGHVEILDADGTTVDRIGWGGAALALTKSTAAPKAGQSVQRTTISAGILSDSGDNSVDFSIVDTPSPRDGGYTLNPPAAPAPTPAPIPEGTPELPTCDGIVISEILPNPAGSDSGREFVELRNPTDEVIALLGCSLQTSANSKSYTFSDISLQPGDYRSFTDTETGLSLPNSSGGTAYLLSPNQELQAVAYPGAMADDLAWALTDGSWAQTYTPTPGAANILTTVQPCPAGQQRNLETNRCVNDTAPAAATAAAGSTTAPAPCKPGQERNPTTNRCRNIASAAKEPAPCKPGQTRNPATNRCAASSAAAAAAKTACKPGQERNPETNRCRNVAGAAKTAKACPAGQVRNAETNRCRKATGAASASSKVEDVKTPNEAGSNRWLIAGLVVAGAIAYAVYEWRQEIRFKLEQLFRRRSAGTIAYRP